MPTNNPNAWRTRTKNGRRSSNTVLAWFPLNGAANTWYYSRGRFVEQFSDVTIFASVDGPVGALANLALRIQAGDGMTRLLHNAYIDLPAADTGMGANPLTIASPAASGTNQQQTITFAAGTSGGNFTLGFAGQTTANTAYSAGLTAAAVQTLLQGLSTVGTAFNNNSRAIVTGANGGPFVVQFFDSLLYADLPLIVATNVSLSGGGSPGVSVAASPTGPLAVNSVSRVADLLRVGVKWGTPGPANTNLILTMKARG